MAIVNGPQFPLLTRGRPKLVGSIAAATDGLQFSMPMENWGYGISFQAVPNGTLTTLTVDIKFSLDGGTTLNSIPAGTRNDATSSLAFATNPLKIISVPGLGGQMTAVFQATALTLGTATKVDIWALVV